MSGPQRILLVRLSHLGDVCHGLPVYHAVRERWPGALLAWAIQPEFAPLVECLPGLERCVRFERRSGLAAWPRVRRELEAFGADLAIDAQGNAKSGLVTRLSGAARRVGLYPGDWRERFGARFVTEHAPPAAGPHALDRMQALVAHVAPGAELRADLPVTDRERAVGRAALAERLPDRGRPRRILHLAAEGDRRSWPAERFGELALLLAEAGEDVLVLSGPAEASPGRRHAGELPASSAVRHWVAQRGLRELAGLCAAAAEADIRVVVCDSGPCHVAAACGVGVDLLGGPQDPARTGPWPPPDRPGSPHRWHLAPGPARAMADLSVETVASALQR